LNFGDGCPVFACHSGNYKPASFGFGAQRSDGQAKLGGDHAEAQERIIVDHDMAALARDARVAAFI
jgi:hypothetical protein